MTRKAWSQAHGRGLGTNGRLRESWPRRDAGATVAHVACDAVASGQPRAVANAETEPGQDHPDAAGDDGPEPAEDPDVPATE